MKGEVEVNQMKKGIENKKEKKVVGKKTRMTIWQKE